MLPPHPLTAGLDALEALLDSLEGIEFFVSVKDAGKTAFLLGPYPTNLEAVQNIPRARELALAADPWSHFYAFGTCSAPIGTIPKTVFDE